MYTGLLAPQTSYGESHATEVEIEASARDAAIRCIHQCLGVCGPSCSNPRELAECCHRHHTEVKYICSEYLVYVSNGCVFLQLQQEQNAILDDFLSYLKKSDQM